MGLSGVERAHRLGDKRKCVTLLTGAGGENRPDALTPALASMATRALGDTAVDEGGLEELREFLFAAASWASSSAMRLSRSAMRAFKVATSWSNSW